MDTQLLHDAIHAAKEAGRRVMEQYAHTVSIEIKSDGSPLTEADTEASACITAYLEKTKIPVLSEEALTIHPPYPTTLWIIDPLDGTKGFIKKTGDFAVMIGLLEHGKPTLGVVYIPVTDTLYYAQKGHGSFMEKHGAVAPLTVSTQTEHLRFIRSINHFSPQMAALGEALNATLMPMGSIGIKAGMLAEGHGDFFASWGQFGIWDVCATQIIVEEAGGIVTDIDGNQLQYDALDQKVHQGILYASAACHTRVRDAATHIHIT